MPTPDYPPEALSTATQEIYADFPRVTIPWENLPMWSRGKYYEAVAKAFDTLRPYLDDMPDPDESRRRLVQVATLHTSTRQRRCRECGFAYPCKTARIADGE